MEPSRCILGLEDFKGLCRHMGYGKPSGLKILSFGVVWRFDNKINHRIANQTLCRAFSMLQYLALTLQPTFATRIATKLTRAQK